MTNQMKGLLVAMLICTYCSLGVGAVVFLINGFSFESFASWIFFFLEIPVAVIGQLLLNYINKLEKEVRSEIEKYNLLQTLREGAILKFYKDNGIKPRYGKDGKLQTPDEFIGILTILTKDGKLEQSVYELLGIMPQFDKDGNEIPFVAVIKHLVETFKTKDLDKIKFKKLVLPKTQETKKTEVKKIEKPQISDTAKKEKKSGAKKKIVMGKKVKGDKKGGKSKGGADKKETPKKPVSQTKEQNSQQKPRVRENKRVDTSGISEILGEHKSYEGASVEEQEEASNTR